MRTVLPLLLFCFLAASCEKSIKVELPAQPSRIVLNAVMHTNDVIEVNVSRSLSIKESAHQTSNQIYNARVLLYIDGQLADTLRPSPVNSMLYISQFKAQEGKSYKLRVEASGYDAVEATAAGTTAVPIMTWELTPQARQSNDWGTQDKLIIGFTDPAGATDHYLLRIAAADDTQKTMNNLYDWGYCVTTSDPSVESPYTEDFGENSCMPASSIFIKDALFDGKDKRLELYVPSTLLQMRQNINGDTLYPHVTLYHVSDDFYRYLKSYLGARGNSGNPFVEPFNVNTNVKNGYGIFGIVASHTETID